MNIAYAPTKNGVPFSAGIHLTFPYLHAFKVLEILKMHFLQKFSSIFLAISFWHFIFAI